MKTNAAAKFRLQSKYKGMPFVDKNPNDEENKLPEGEWEHRVITELIWRDKQWWAQS